MSAMLNMNEPRYIPWKGKTFNQVISSLQKNTITANSRMTGKLLFMAPPLKIYRKEAATANVTSCNPRISTSIDGLNAPNGYMVNPVSSTPNSNGLVNTLDFNYENNRYEHPGTCNAMTQNGACMDVETNARKRVRSAGMIRSKKHNYYTSTTQYLASRTMSFDQNQYSHFRSGNSSAKPGTNAGIQNIYAPNSSVDFCPVTGNCKNNVVVYKPSNPLFAQDGGVSASSRIARLKYDTITTNGLLYTRSYGNAVGNALSYGTDSDKYTIKDKIGFPNRRTPIISKWAPNVVACCTVPPTTKMG